MPFRQNQGMVPASREENKSHDLVLGGPKSKRRWGHDGYRDVGGDGSPPYGGGTAKAFIFLFFY